jgi:hypothetical protein
MSNIKNLLGDMDFEEFGVKRKSVLDKVKALEINEFNDLCCDDTATFYDYWLEIGGKGIAYERVQNHYGGQVTLEQVDEFAQYLLDRFIGWLKSF